MLHNASSTASVYLSFWAALFGVCSFGGEASGGLALWGRWMVCDEGVTKSSHMRLIHVGRWSESAPQSSPTPHDSMDAVRRACVSVSMWSGEVGVCWRGSVCGYVLFIVW